MSPLSCSVWSPRATGRQLRFPTPLLRTPPSWGPDSSLHLFVQGVFCHQPTPLGSLREHGAHHDPSLGKHFALPPRGNVLSYHQTLESIFKGFFFLSFYPVSASRLGTPQGAKTVGVQCALSDQYENHSTSRNSLTFKTQSRKKSYSVT